MKHICTSMMIVLLLSIQFTSCTNSTSLEGTWRSTLTSCGSSASKESSREQESSTADKQELSVRGSVAELYLPTSDCVEVYDAKIEITSKNTFELQDRERSTKSSCKEDRFISKEPLRFSYKLKDQNTLELTFGGRCEIFQRI